MQIYHTRKRDHTLQRYSLQEVTHEKDNETLTLEEILLNLKDAEVFSITEKKCGYRNVVPGKEYINFTTFGRYRFRHVPFSLKMSQEVFQTKRDQTFEGKWLDVRDWFE